MIRRKIAAGLVALLAGTAVGACSTDGEVDADPQGPGRSAEEDPTLGDPDGGGTSDRGEDGTGGQRRDDGADEGDPANTNTDNGTGTGAGRGDG